MKLKLTSFLWIGLGLIGLLIWSHRLSAEGVMTIGEVQGAGESSPFEKQLVTVEGIVTGISERTSSDGKASYTFFVQNEIDSADVYTDTSDALAVYTGKTLPPVAIGDKVQVTGEVVEFFGMTEIGVRQQQIKVISQNNPLPPPVLLQLPATQLDQRPYLESLENMIVSLGDQEGTITVATALDCAFTLVTADSFEWPVFHANDQQCGDFPVVAVGERVKGVAGPLVYSFEAYQILQSSPLSVTLTYSSPMRLVEGLPPTSILPAIANGRSDQPKGFLITEVYSHALLNDSEEEWIEITNVGASALSLNGYYLGDAESPNSREGMVRFPDSAEISPRRSIIVAQTASAFTFRYGFKPNFEINDTDPAVPNMQSSELAGGSIQLANGGDELILLDPQGALVDGMSYGSSNKIFKPSAQLVGSNQSLERIPADCDNDIAFDFKPQQKPTPGFITLEGSCEPPGELDPTKLNLEKLPPIGAVQGSGDISPYINQFVAFRGVVIGMHEDRNSAGLVFHTLYVQDLPGQEDGDPATSDGIAVFTGKQKLDVTIGDDVLVIGRPIEYYGLTEITDEELDLRVLGHNATLPSAIELQPPTTSAEAATAYYEPLEGMLIHLGYAPAKTVGATFMTQSSCGFAVVRQDSGIGRIYRRQASDSVAGIIPIMYHDETTCDTDFPQLKFGDEISGLMGPLTYNFEQFRLIMQSAEGVIVDSAPFPPFPTVPTITESQFSLISFNVENLFDEIDDTGLSAEPKLTPEELDTKLTKISYAIGTILHCPTIVAIQEVEKASLLAQLADRLAEKCSFTYRVVHAESPDTRGIDLAYLVDPTRTELIDARLKQACTKLKTNIDDPQISCPDGEDPLFSRPPFRLDIKIDGRLYTIFNNHLKSKRGGELESSFAREGQAEHLAKLVNGIYQNHPNARVIVAGDFNDYENSQPLNVLQDNGLFNVLTKVAEAERYSFVFSGAAQMIDALLVSPDVETLVASADIIHTNADYPDSYSTETTPELLPYKATDHDIPYLVINLDALDSAEITPEPTEKPIENEVDSADGELLGRQKTTNDNDWWLAILAIIGTGVGGYWLGKRK